MTFQSTRSAWSATGSGVSTSGSPSISIHALRMERDACSEEEWVMTGIFQSTRSAWSATGQMFEYEVVEEYFNPRAPHGARPCRAGALSSSI